jgi:hypothetical protein
MLEEKQEITMRVESKSRDEGLWNCVVVDDNSA